MQLGSLLQQPHCRVRSRSRSSCSPRVSFRPHPGRLAVRASAEGAAALPQPSDSSSSRRGSTTGSSSSSSGLPGDAVYLKAPLPGGTLSYPDRSVVVLGDVPRGASISAGGDVIVLGTLAGTAAAGTGGDASAVVLINRLAPGGTLTIAGRGPAGAAGAGEAAAGEGSAAGPGRDSQLMLVLEAGAAAATWVAMPGTPPLPAAAAAPSLAGKLGRIAGAMAVLLLGLALVLAPGAVLGNLLSTSAESVAGALLDAFVFGFIILQGAGLLSEGSELLLEVVNPGIIGGVVLPVLGALPDSLIILSSLSATRAEAEAQVAVGVGTLAGSSILLLSVAWGASIVLGRCDLNERGVMVDRTLSRPWDWSRTGVSVDPDVARGAAIMGASSMLYGIVQVPAFLGATEAPTAALAGAVASLSCCVAYCVYSVLSPQLQQRRIDAARRKRFRMVAVKALATRSNDVYGSSLVDPLGRLNTSTARTIFDEFDKDGSGAIDSTEVQGLLLGLQLAGDGGSSSGSGSPDELKFLFKELDVDGDRSISFEEFSGALSRWVGEKMATAAGGSRNQFTGLLDPRRGGAAATVLADLPPDDLAALQETALELEGESPDEAAGDLEGGAADEAPLSTREILLRAAGKMGGGIALCAVFSDPLVEALTNLSHASGINPFIVGFVLTPLASNSSELVSSLTFAARKRRKNMSLTLSQVYGAVTLNNTLVLGLFLLVVYNQRLPWVYSSEVAVVVSATLALAATGATRSSFPLWMAVPALLLYPASLLGVWALDTFLGWQ